MRLAHDCRVRDDLGATRNVSFPPPKRPRTALLDFSEMDEYRFQDFSRDFVAHELPGSDPYQYGKRGEKQGGIDLAASDGAGTWGFQCRHVKKFQPVDVRHCVEDASFPADQYVILLTSVASVRVRDEVAKYPKWRIWDRRDISAKIGDLAHDVSYRIVDRHFGPAYAAEFVAAAPPQALLQDATEYFAPAEHASRLLRYDWQTVGRASALVMLDEAIDADGIRVVLLPGRGGIGKTHVLRELSRRSAGPGALRYLRRDSVSSEALTTALVPGTVLVVDDAHRRDDIREIVSALRAVPKARAILALRPWASAGVRAELTRADFDSTEIRELPELKELGRDETRSLSAQALGRRRSGLIDALVAVSWDSPLVTVVGGQLIAEGLIDARLLDRQEEFRRTALDRFETDLLRPIVDRVGAPNAHRLTEFLAAVGPLRLENRALVEAAADFLKIDAPTFITVVGLFEEAGVLLRRGRLLRITPDVLADHILYRACVTAGGDATGYADAVFDAVADASLETVLANLAELDWRQAKTKGPDVFSGIWDRVLARMAERPDQRFVLLRQLPHLAYTQPGRVLDLVEGVLAGAAHNETEPPDDLRRALPAMLRGACYSLEHLPRALQALWLLGRDDARPTNQHPDHAMRVLEEVAGYGPRKPIDFGWRVLDTVRAWVAEPDAFAHAHSPLDVLDPLLAKSGHESWWTGAAVEMRGFIINEKATRPLRDGVIALLDDLSKDERVDVRLRVVKTVGEALHGPVGYFGQPVTEEARVQWQAEEKRLLGILEAMRGKDPLVDLRLRDELVAYARGASGERRLRAERAIHAISESEEFRLVLGLSRYWDLDALPVDHDPETRFEDGQRLTRELQEQAAAELVVQHRDAHAGAAVLGELLQRLEKEGFQPQPGSFLAVLSRLHPEYALVICDEIAGTSRHALGRYLAPLLEGVSERHPERARAVVESTLQHDNVDAVASIAAVVGRPAWRGPGMWELITRLAGHPNLWVRERAIWALAQLREVDPGRAAAILVSIDFGDNAALADEVLGRVGHGELPLTLLSDAQIDDVLVRLRQPDGIAEYWIWRFIEAVAPRRPVSVGQLFVARTELALTRGTNYRPIPWDREDVARLTSLEGTAEHAQLLRRVRDRYDGTTGLRRWHQGQLFALLSADYGPTALSVLMEWGDSQDEAKIRSAADLLKEAPWSFVFEQEAFVVHLLERANAAGVGCYRSVGGALMALATSGTWSGTPGQPAPRHVEQRDRADAVAQTYAIGAPSRRFYEALRDSAIREIEDERNRDAEDLDL